MAYKISTKANQDFLDLIWIYTFENWSQTQADRYYELLINEIIYISEHIDSEKIMVTFENAIDALKSNRI